MSQDLQTRFAAALRTALAGDSGKPGTSVLTVRAPDVHVTPEIRAVLPELPQPFEVADVDRWAGAWRYKLEVTRDGNGFIKTAEMLPTKFVSAEEIQK